jgi:hypothetical protein
MDAGCAETLPKKQTSENRYEPEFRVAPAMSDSGQECG